MKRVIFGGACGGGKTAELILAIQSFIKETNASGKSATLYLTSIKFWITIKLDKKNSITPGDTLAVHGVVFDLKTGEIIDGITATEYQAILILQKESAMPASLIGMELWAKKKFGHLIGMPLRVHTMYCRPAGRLLHGLKKKGLVYQFWNNDKRRFLWKLT